MWKRSQLPTTAPEFCALCKSRGGYRSLVQAWDDAVEFEIENGASPWLERNIGMPLSGIPQMPEGFLVAIIPGDETSLAPLPTLRAADDYRPFSPPLPDSNGDESDEDFYADAASSSSVELLLPFVTLDESRAPSPATSVYVALAGDDDEYDYVMSDFSLLDEGESLCDVSDGCQWA